MTRLYDQPDVLATVARMAAEGHDDYTIASALRCSHWTVKRARQIGGVRAGVYVAEERRHAERLEALKSSRTIAEAAARVGIDHQAFVSWMKQHDISAMDVWGRAPIYRMTGPKLSQLRSMAEAGRPDHEIAEALGCSLDNVKRWRWRYNIPSGSEAIQRARIARIKQMLAENKSRAEMAQALGMKLAGLEKFMRLHRLTRRSVITETVRQMQSQGLPARTIRAVTGYGREAVQRRMEARQ